MVRSPRRPAVARLPTSIRVVSRGQRKSAPPVSGPNRFATLAPLFFHPLVRCSHRSTGRFLTLAPPVVADPRCRPDQRLLAGHHARHRRPPLRRLLLVP